MKSIFFTCNILSSIGTVGLTVLSISMLVLFGLILYTISKKKRKAKQNLSAFSQSVQQMLDKFETAEQKIETLNLLVDRIKLDEKYQKTPEWKDSVLAKVYEHLAKLYYQKNDEKGIVEASTKIIQYDPSNGMAYYNRGSIYSNWGEYKKALADFNDALIILPQYAGLYNNRGLVYTRLNRNEDALRDFDKAIELESSPIVFYNRANLYYDENKLEKALVDYQAFLNLDISNQYNLRKEVEEIISHIESRLSQHESTK